MSGKKYPVINANDLPEYNFYKQPRGRRHLYPMGICNFDEDKN